MPGKRKRSSSLITRKRRIRPYVMKRLRGRRRTPLALKQHNFVESLQSDTIINIDTEANSTMVGRAFGLNQIAQAAAYKDLFEYYRIDKVVATFRYKGTAAPATTGSGLPRMNEVNPVIFFKVDHDDISSQSVAVMRQSAKTREHQLSNDKPEFTITFKPAVQVEIYKTTLSSAYGPKWGTWLRCDDDNVPHYGLKMHVCAYKTADFDPGQVIVSYKMYVSFKNNE